MAARSETARGGASSTKRGSLRARIVKRGLLLAVTGISLYLLAPALIEVFGSWRQLRELEAWGLVAAVALVAASFFSLWALQRLAFGTERWWPVITSQLAANAFGRVVPGGGATAAAFQFRMLAEYGIAGSKLASGLTAVNLLTFGTLLTLPLLAVPGLIAGRPPSDDLLRGLWAVLAALAFLIVVAALLMATDRPLRAIGRLAQRIRNAIMRRRPPLTGLPDRLIDERNYIRNRLGDHRIKATLTAIGKWAFDLAALLVILVALDSPARASLVVVAYSISNLLGMVPLTPGGLGFAEAGLTGTLVLAGVSAGDALVATLAYRLVSFWLPLPVGLAAALAHRHQMRKHGRKAVPLELETQEGAPT